MHRLSLVLLLAAGAACSSSAGSPVRGREVSTVSMGGSEGGTLRVIRDDTPATAIIAVPLANVWAALPATFDSIGVPVTFTDPKTRVIGTEGSKVRVRMGGVALSRYFDCGTTQIGANADSYEILLTVLAQLKPAPANTTTIEIRVMARARPVAFRQAYSDCQIKSNNTLDERLVAVLRRQLAK